MRVMMLLLAGFTTLPGYSQAQEARGVAAKEVPACTVPAVPPAEFATWNAVQPLAAASSPDDAQATVFPLGAARSVTLMPVERLRYAAQPMRPDDDATNGGLVAFDVAVRGIYRVALSSGAWIEVVSGRRTRQSVGHGHGPDCSGIRKIVDFELSPGRYLLQLSDSTETQVTVMIAPAVRPAAAR